MRLRLGVDVGGTFTDIYLQDASTGSFWIAKTPTTPEDQSIGVLNGINEACARAGVEPESLTAILHGTTVATNAVLEGKGAPVGLLITSGWKYLLHLGSSWTPGPLFGFFSYQKPEPMVPLERIYEISERVKADGSVLTPLDTGEVERAVNALIDQNVEAITICFLNSFAESAHEIAAAGIAQAVCAQRGVQLPISCSHEVSGEFRDISGGDDRDEFLSRPRDAAIPVQPRQQPQVVQCRRSTSRGPFRRRTDVRCRRCAAPGPNSTVRPVWRSQRGSL